MNLNVLNNIKKAISDVWIEVYDVYPNLLSSPEWVLTKRQKELWVVVIDIWTSTTWVTVYEEWVLKFASIIPIWWDSVTNDIALWLRTSIDVAEKLKIEYCELDLENSEWFKDEEVDLSRTEIWEDITFSRLYLSQIATARYEEILFFVKQELKKIWKDWMLPEWAICVWWGSKQSNFVDFAKKVLKLPVFIWIPVSKDELLDTAISDPVFAPVIWTLLLVNRYTPVSTSFSLNIGWIFASMIKVFKKILP
jgi:cell division protein FtsA